MRNALQSYEGLEFASIWIRYLLGEDMNQKNLLTAC